MKQMAPTRAYATQHIVTQIITHHFERLKYSFDMFRNFVISELCVNLPRNRRKNMKTYRLENIDKKAAEQVEILLHMLDSKLPGINAERLGRLVKDEDLYLFVTEADGQLAGMLTLTFCETLSRRKYWIEDVIVNSSFRGQGLGRSLVRAAVDFARKKEGLPTIYLTSNPSRISARSLYISEGFEEYETGVFKLDQA